VCEISGARCSIGRLFHISSSFYSRNDQLSHLCRTRVMQPVHVDVDSGTTASIPAGIPYSLVNFSSPVVRLQYFQFLARVLALALADKGIWTLLPSGCPQTSCLHDLLNCTAWHEKSRLVDAAMIILYLYLPRVTTCMGT